MQTNNIDRFLNLCKKNYQEKVTPANTLSYNTTGYLELKEIASEYFSNGKYAEFASLLNEGQYFIALWAAHLLLEYGEPSKELMFRALVTIIEYSDNPLAINVAKEEKAWLNNIDITFPRYAGRK